MIGYASFFVDVEEFAADAGLTAGGPQAFCRGRGAERFSVPGMTSPQI